MANPYVKPRQKPATGKEWAFSDELGTWTEVRLYHQPSATPYANLTNQGANEGKGGRKNLVRGRLRLDSPKKGVKRADVKSIRAWIARRHYCEWWRLKDGTYAAMATFYGETAGEKLANALRGVPKGGAYGAITVWRRVSANTAVGQKSGFELLDKRTVLVTERSPTVSLNENGKYGYLLSFFYDGSGEILETRAGCVVHWVAPSE